jgi:hypothetical protein
MFWFSYIYPEFLIKKIDSPNIIKIYFRADINYMMAIEHMLKFF